MTCRPDEVESAIEAYRAAKKHADFTCDFMDAVAADVAWNNFLRLFYEDKDDGEERRGVCGGADDVRPQDVQPKT